MLDSFAKDLPDLDFTVNARPDGRVVVPWEHLVHSNLTDLNPSYPSPAWDGEGSVWEAWRRTCSPTAPARRLYSSLGSGWAGATGARDRLAEGHYAWQARIQGLDEHNADGTFSRSLTSKLPNEQAGTTQSAAGTETTFVRGTGMNGVDFCRSPGERYEQGHFFSHWRTYPLLVPILSPARAQGFGDIRIPSHYYYGGTKRYTYAWDPIDLEQRRTDPMEVPWERKRDAVWWRGASTGGGNSPPGFGEGYQRHWFVRMASVGRLWNDGADVERTTTVVFEPPVPAAKVELDDETEVHVGY
ncbi:CAP10 domain-containing protein [Mycena chlorophos]|uniref:CAP10 domain-containing protein n=1 Tax=Mycena chlorophos TaxID=658473 RepID=A0A8H6TNA8_MYCCL|nr:CAP10 domain-containing protein [Mycena chlorophos]